MNNVDKVITKLLVEKNDNNPYLDKSNWSWFDYVMGYGLPLGMLYGVIRIIMFIIENGI